MPGFLIGDAIPVQEAAQKLAAPARDAFETHGDLDMLEDELDRLWVAILRAAEETPHDQQAKLVDIVRTIKEMPQPVHADKKLEIWGQEQKWSDLPLFGATAREELDVSQDKPGPASVNLNAFYAQITAAGVNDLSLYAIWVLREALEDPDEDKVASTSSPNQLQSASVWLIYAADTLAAAAKETRQFEGKIAEPGSSLSSFDGAPGWRGFCQERWQTWVSRLTTLKEAEVATEAKSLISQALERASKV